MTNKLNLTCKGSEKLKPRQRNFYTDIAIQLGYVEILDDLFICNTEGEATRLMTTARERRMK